MDDNVQFVFPPVSWAAGLLLHFSSNFANVTHSLQKIHVWLNLMGHFEARLYDDVEQKTSAAALTG